MGPGRFWGNIMTTSRAALILACTLLLAGCLPVTTKTPVGTTAGLAADPALTGTWAGHSQDQPDAKPNAIGQIYLHFLKRKDDGTLTALLVMSATNSDDDGWMSFALTGSTLGPNHYLNAVITGNNGGDPDAKKQSFPVPYRIAHGTLTLYLLDEDKVKSLMEKGAIAGTVEQGSYGDVEITADPKPLDAFFARPEVAKLFKVFLVLRKTE
jgi:hypothetical protein